MRSLDFRVTVVDDNPEKLKENGFLDIEDLHSEDMESYAERLSPESNAYIIILTRGFSKDKYSHNHSAITYDYNSIFTHSHHND